MYKQLSTPCFVLDKSELARSINGFQQALRDRFNRSIVGYSVKTNSLPAAMSIARDCGCYAEVVSHDEYSLARSLGYSVNQIIYNGPMKSESTFLEAVIGGAIVNIDTRRELEWLKKLPSDGIFNIGIRLNINISQVSPSDADGDNDNSRFGFSDATGELSDVIYAMRQMKNVRISGLHIHRTAHSRSIDFYRNSILYACSMIDKHGLSLDYLDIGGGYFGIFPNKPTYDDYATAFHDILTQEGKEHLQIIIEPGNALVASCFKFITSVIDVKHTEANHWFITTDGSRNDIDPFFRKSGYLYELHRQSTNNASVAALQTISGCTCLEYDRLFEISNQPLLSVGDYIIYNNVGAYTMCLSPLFIRYFPTVYLLDGSSFSIVRERWTEEKVR